MNDQERALKAINKLIDENGSLECYKTMGQRYWWKYTIRGVKGDMCGPHPVDAILGEGEARSQEEC